MSTETDRAAQVAEKVMGWRCAAPPSSMRSSFVFWADGRHRYVGIGEWDPWDNADHDYEVLQRVREEFMHAWSDRFQKGLAKLWVEREAVVPNHRWHLTETGAGWQYEPGDYASAALAALGDAKEVKHEP